MSLTVELHHPQVLEILQNHSPAEQSQIVEMYILLGDMIVRSTQIMTSEESLGRHFAPVTNDLRQMIERLSATHATLESQLPATVKTVLDGAVSSVKHEIAELEKIRDRYDEMLAQVLPTLAKPHKKGAVSAEAVLVTLQNTFKNHCFEDVSQSARFTDILGRESASGEPILIEVKNYTDQIPSQEVKKFWRDMEERQARVGCFISLNTGIGTVTQDMDIQMRGGQFGVFVVSALFGDRGHIYAYLVARRLLEALSRHPRDVGAEKAAWVADILNNRLRFFKTELLSMQKIEADLRKASGEIQTQLEKVTRMVSNLRVRLEAALESTVDDFSPSI
jgi:ABC-type transporter Mla subunit MlaD